MNGEKTTDEEAGERQEDYRLFAAAFSGDDWTLREIKREKRREKAISLAVIGQRGGNSWHYNIRPEKPFAVELQIRKRVRGRMLGHSLVVNYCAMDRAIIGPRVVLAQMWRRMRREMWEFTEMERKKNELD